MSAAAFRASIRKAIANESLQAALDGNAVRRVTGRVTAFESLPDWRERRQRARAIRADVIEHLDAYVEQFTAKAEANGMIVHRAADGAEAVAIILEIARATVTPGAGPSSLRSAPLAGRVIPKFGDDIFDKNGILIAKSKSMVSEEIELNHALEREGIRVVETDLGEYIVQLRGEKPAHIITPAVHLRRHEVAQLFEQQLGLPYTEDIPTLTAAARKVLREVFLTANVGISGVNFGVAETGTLCVVTNEGNGRMVTTMPPVHIALMGMERLLPQLEDLALLLSLLPRSATGQKLSVYTQLIHGPRRDGEVDGAPARHLVILDNGRRRLRASPLREILYCIRCGACLNACPVFREIGGHAYVGSDGSIAPYSGPIGSVVSPGLLGMQQFGHLAQASSLCGACKDACPVDIDLPKLLTRVRAGSKEAPSSSDGVGLSAMSRVGLHAFGAIASSRRLFTVSQALGALGTHIVSPFAEWFRIPAMTGWGYSKDFPRMASKTFRQRWQRGKAAEPRSPQDTSEPVEAPATTEAREPAADRFCRELEALGGTVCRVRAADLHEQLLRFLRENNVEKVLAWEQVEGVERGWLKENGIEATSEPDPTVKAGITGAAAAIAETGTLVVTSGRGKPLTASLLPEIHVAVIKSSQIAWSLEEALLHSSIPEAASAALITGPSRTADIEMTLTIGVHGPKELRVYLVE